MHKANSSLTLGVTASAVLAAAVGTAAQEPVELPHPATEAQTDQRLIADGAGRPEGFPEDVPLYEAMESPTVAWNASSYTVRGQTPDSGVRVARQLNKSMAEQGWQRVANDRNPSEHHMTFTKGERNIDVTLTLEDQVTLIYMEVPEGREDSGASRSPKPEATRP